MPSYSGIQFFDLRRWLMIWKMMTRRRKETVIKNKEPPSAKNCCVASTGKMMEELLS
jgi:hypothetical protein